MLVGLGTTVEVGGTDVAVGTGVGGISVRVAVGSGVDVGGAGTRVAVAGTDVGSIVSVGTGTGDVFEIAAVVAEDSGAPEVHPERTNAEKMATTVDIQICREIRVVILVTNMRLLE